MSLKHAVVTLWFVLASPMGILLGVFAVQWGMFKKCPLGKISLFFSTENLLLFPANGLCFSNGIYILP